MAKAPDPYDIEIVNAPPAELSDLYHRMLTAPWWVDFISIAAVFVVANLLFAAGFYELHGVQNAATFADCFFFSVQTMGTIGYGAMYPTTMAANVLVVVEAIFGVILVALFTGLVFAKFSAPRGRVRFAEKIAVSPVDGVPTVMMRCGNLRSNQLVEARVRLALVRTEISKEGTQFYKMYDLKLARETTPLFTRSWTVFHRIEPDSPFHGATPQSLEKDEVEILVTLTGMDENLSQTVHARYRYFARDVAFGVRHADVLTDLSHDRMRLDLAQFDVLVPTKPIEAFPFGTP